MPELELVRVAQILTISSELCQAYKFAAANSSLRKQFNLETRVSLAAAAQFTATDYLQVSCIQSRLSPPSCCMLADLPAESCCLLSKWLARICVAGVLLARMRPIVSCNSIPPQLRLHMCCCRLRKSGRGSCGTTGASSLSRASTMLPRPPLAPQLQSSGRLTGALVDNMGSTAQILQAHKYLFFMMESRVQMSQSEQQ